MRRPIDDQLKEKKATTTTTTKHKNHNPKMYEGLFYYETWE